MGRNDGSLFSIILLVVHRVDCRICNRRKTICLSVVGFGSHGGARANCPVGGLAVKPTMIFD